MREFYQKRGCVQKTDIPVSYFLKLRVRMKHEH